jgi:hypothetical protein
MSAQFTPGPWTLSEDEDRIHAVNCPDDGGDIICEFPDALASNERWLVNARLIAAAPDLLEALVAIDLARHTDAPCDWEKATRLSDAAIAKATGAA